MLLSEQGGTPFDLQFRLFGVRVRVHPFFWLVSAIFGWSWLDLGFEFLAMWIGCVFVSILLHEFGHIWMGQAFGNYGHIVLQGLCGMAIGSSGQWHRWQRVLVSLAGPGIQLIFYFILMAICVFGSVYSGDSLTEWVRSTLTARDRGKITELPRLAEAALNSLLWINLYWPIMNLLPVWPLDGGHVCRELCTWFSRQKGIRYSLIVSIVVSVGVALNSLSGSSGGWHVPYIPSGGRYFVFFFGILAFESFQLLMIENARRSRWVESDERQPWEQDPDWWKR